MTYTRAVALWLVAVALFTGIPMAVHRLTGFSELPVLHGIAWLVAGLVLYPWVYPWASDTVQRHKHRQLRFIDYFAVMLGIAVFGMSVEGLLVR